MQNSIITHFVSTKLQISIVLYHFVDFCIDMFWLIIRDFKTLCKVCSRFMIIHKNYGINKFESIDLEFELAILRCTYDVKNMDTFTTVKKAVDKFMLSNKCMYLISLELNR